MTTSVPVTHDPFAEYTLAELYDELFDTKATPTKAKPARMTKSNKK